MSSSPIKRLVFRLLNPLHLMRMVILQKNKRRVNRAFDDAQLKLYHQLLPGDHLHYGYFDDPNISPLNMSLNMIYAAQERYAQLLADLVLRTDLPVLDVGCGMGGLLGEFNKRKITAIGLTPDANQVAHIQRTYKNELLACRFEDMEVSSMEGTFGSLVTSESLQYLDLKLALPLIDKLLVPGGRWIACDYFRQGAAAEKSGHYWDHFVRLLDKHGFEIKESTDITPHILPTIAYAYHWGAHIIQPLMHFGADKLKVKAPGWHYAVADVIDHLFLKLHSNLATVDPVQFAASKKYILMVIERKKNDGSF